MKRKIALGCVMLCGWMGIVGVGVAASCNTTGSIIQVKKSTHLYPLPVGVVETVEFDVKSPAPTYAVTTVVPPFYADPSGNPVSVVGPRFKQIRFSGIDWMCTIPTNLALPTTRIKGVKQLGQFEGIVTYVVGYTGLASKYLGTSVQTVNPSTKRVVMKFKKW